jgi:carbonic anhydrase
MNLPDPKNNVGEGVIKEALNPLDFIFDDPEMITNSTPFNWYRYMGSMTQPPCAG